MNNKRKMKKKVKKKKSLTVNKRIITYETDVGSRTVAAVVAPMKIQKVSIQTLR
jgi:hypothetical protein